MYSPTKSEAETIAKSGRYDVIPISTELYSDSITPIRLLRILKNVSGHCFMLESIENPQRWGRYTFLGFQPTLELTCQNGRMTVTSATKTTFETADPGAYIQKLLDESKSPKLPGLPPFTGGLVGYFSYEYGGYVEPSLATGACDGECFNDVDLMLFDKVIAFDHFRQKLILIVNIKAAHIETEYNRGVLELQSLVNLIKTGAPEPDRPAKITSEFRPLFTKAAFCEMTKKAKEYIREGDIFQVVLSNRMEADFEGSLLDTYRLLRTTNPSPYMFYLGSDNQEIAGASPETLVKLQDGTLYTFPLAGTRPRGESEAEDQQLERDLLSDEKELAEHNMLVDLGRNDLGKISEFGTVAVEKYLSVERFSHVMHIGSTVRGAIQAGKTGMDAIRAVLPAGTLSGAPKLRAMQIIQQLEGGRRDIYGGAIGYLDFTGNMDTCIAIRIAFRKNGKVYVRSGAGIVADSVPESEYTECLNKAKAVMDALKRSEGGIGL